MQGTASFIAIELLVCGSSHRVSHDLESLFYVLLFICTHLEGPFRKIRNPPLYGCAGTPGPTKKYHSGESGLHLWFQQDNLSSLGFVKNSQIVNFFETMVLEHISPYFLPIKDYIKLLWQKLIPKTGSHLATTPKDFIEVFKAALLDKELIVAHNSHLSVLGKRSAPCDLVGVDGWDPESLPKKRPSAIPNIAAVPTRRKAKLLQRR
jgi:hypothetical protein